jgi:DNA-3-methyladenine glycosylase II
MNVPFDAHEAVDTLRRADELLAGVIQATGPFTLKLQRLQSPFHALMRAIVYQQLSGKAAATILSRTQALFPSSKPTPELVLEIPDDVLRSAGLSRNKAASLKDLAAKTLDGTVPSLARMKRMTDEEIIEHLVQVRGIGRWTVEATWASERGFRSPIAAGHCPTRPDSTGTASVGGLTGASPVGISGGLSS